MLSKYHDWKGEVLENYTIQYNSHLKSLILHLNSFRQHFFSEGPEKLAKRS